ncbi:O-acetyl-ADP-ribose deacetylase [[Eubacterium] cellulosolvens]
MEVKIGRTTVSIIQGDITEQETDAIVNAANSTLMGGGGVDGAIHKKGGKRILDECKKVRKIEYKEGLPTGKAVITNGGSLKADYVIHTVGPIWRGGNHFEEKFLRDAYQNSLGVAIDKGIKTISFPSISTGAYGFPITKASRIAINAVKDYLERNVNLEKVVFVLFSEGDFRIYRKAMKEILKND